MLEVGEQKFVAASNFRSDSFVVVDNQLSICFWHGFELSADRCKVLLEFTAAVWEGKDNSELVLSPCDGPLAVCLDVTRWFCGS